MHAHFLNPLLMHIFNIQDRIELAVLRKCGSTSEVKAANAILPLLSNPNMLLVTLLLLNSAVSGLEPLCCPWGMHGTAQP